MSYHRKTELNKYMDVLPRCLNNLGGKSELLSKLHQHFSGYSDVLTFGLNSHALFRGITKILPLLITLVCVSQCAADIKLVKDVSFMHQINQITGCFFPLKSSQHLQCILFWFKIHLF